MVCENPADKTKEMNDSGLIVPNSAQQPMVAPETGVASESKPSRQSADSSIKCKNGQEPVAEKVDHSQPANYYNYYYPGYSQPTTQSNEGRDHSSTGLQGNHGSMAYYMPASYNPYAAGAFIGADGQYVSQPFYTTSAYPVTYGTEALPCYAWDSSHTRDASNGSNGALGASNSTPSATTRVRSNGIKPWQLYGPAICKGSAMSSNAKSPQPVTSTSNVSQPKFRAQPLKPLNKSSSNFQSASGYENAYRPTENFQSSFNKQGYFANNGAMGYRPNTRIWNGNDKQKFDKRSEHGMSTELTRGPRVQNRSSSSSSEKDAAGLAVKRERYNLPDFQTEYEAAKFYVIKSYSEDDVHRCLKYAVWSSTANGNKKLDAAFHDAEVKSSESGTKCPIFLFFSVNGSGQFVGMAEMMGKVDFNKNMDFWQLDKWNGFFPVKWHIVKDVPNPQLRHILLENNENRPVTYTRDTQEIGLKQGLEMLKIFKNYSAKTSLLDDFEFYEDREKAIQTSRSSKSGVHRTDLYGNGNLSMQLATEAKGEVASVSSLVDHTKNLSLNSDPKVAL